MFEEDRDELVSAFTLLARNADLSGTNADFIWEHRERRSSPRNLYRQFCWSQRDVFAMGAEWLQQIQTIDDIKAVMYRMLQETMIRYKNQSLETNSRTTQVALEAEYQAFRLMIRLIGPFSPGFVGNMD